MRHCSPVTHSWLRFSRCCAALITAIFASHVLAAAPAVQDPGVPILVYHRFGPMATDAMTVRTSTFRWQLDYLRQHGRPIIPLRALISYLRGHAPAPSPGSVVITADDGHVSVFTEMLPIVRDYNVPVTLFIYPSAITNASYAMTWQQLDTLQRTGLFDIQSHTFWHPNFKNEKQRLSPTAYRTFTMTQLVKSRTVLKGRLGAKADLIAWPFGIYDDELIAMARDAGYIAGFTLDRRAVAGRDDLLALPRFLVTDHTVGPAFASMLPGENR